MTSIRRELAWRTAVAAAVLLVAAGLLAYLGARRLLVRQFDAVLVAKLATVAARFEQEGVHVEIDFDAAYMPEYADREPLEYFEVWFEDDPARSTTLGANDLPRRLGTLDDPEVFDLSLPDGRRGRAMGARVRIARYEPADGADPGPAEVDIMVAKGREELDRMLVAWLVGVLTGALLLVGAGAYLGWSAIDRGLATMGELVAHVEEIRDPTRARPFDPQRAPAELRPVADGLNGLVERIGLLLARERRTSADIAHELRTPLAELLLLADVSLRFGAGDGDARRALTQVREVGLQMRSQISTLLQLARIEAGELELSREPVDLSSVVSACWESLASVAAGRGMSFERQGNEFVEADPEGLAILVGNLLANAVDHAPEDSTVRCEILRQGHTVEFAVGNPAGDLDQDDLLHLTEPFWRADGARSEREHAGLGLALADRLAVLMGARLRFELAGGEFLARVRFSAPARAVSA